MSSVPSSKRARDLYDSALVWDAHAGLFPDPAVDLEILDAWRTAGVDYLSINVGFDVLDWQKTLATLASYRRQVLDRGDDLVLAGEVKDIDRAAKEGKLAVSFDLEGMNALSGNLDMVAVYHALGVRQMLFAYNLNNAAAGGCHDEDQGLTAFGRRIVSEMNRLGIVVDCSHVGHRTSMDLIEASSAPVVFSHSNPSAIWMHQRNIADDQVRACAETGGVIGVNGMGIFLGDNDIGEEAILRHLCHLAELAGAEHVGFGFDYSPQIDIDVGDILRSRPDYWPPGNLYDTPNIAHAGPPQLPALVEGLTARGFDDEEIHGILGGNFRRVAEAVWARPASSDSLPIETLPDPAS